MKMLLKISFILFLFSFPPVIFTQESSWNYVPGYDSVYPEKTKFYLTNNGMGVFTWDGRRNIGNTNPFQVDWVKDFLTPFLKPHTFLIRLLVMESKNVKEAWVRIPIQGSGGWSGGLATNIDISNANWQTIEVQTTNLGQMLDFTTIYLTFMQNAQDSTKDISMKVAVDWIKSVDEVTTYDDFGGTVDISDQAQIPSGFQLSQNYPNPFNPSTKIRVFVPENGNYQLVVYNTLGQIVDVLVKDHLSTGTYYTFEFNASRLPSGVYIYRLTGQGVNLIKKMVLLK